MFNLDPQQFTSLMLFVFWLLASGFVYAYHWFLHRLPATQQAKLQELVKIGVHAAEQVGSPQVNKKQYALNSIEDLCKQFKVNFDPVIVGHFIEAAVLELKTLVPTPLLAEI